MPVIMNPVDLLNQASDYTTELTWKPSSSIKDATFFYLKTPTSKLNSNKADDWGPALGDGKINTEGLSWVDSSVWGSGTYVENATNVTNSNVNSWPSTHGEYDSEEDGYVLSENSTHWKTIFNAYKDTIKTQLSMENLQESDVEAIILTPFKVSRYNVTDKSYHVDCKVEVKCHTFATATFKLWDETDNEYKFHSAENYQVGSLVTFPKMPDKLGYTFSGWYLDEGLTGSALDKYTIENNVTFYAKYTPKTYTVAFNSKGGSSVRSQEVNHGAKATTPTKPTREGYEFQGWYTDEDTTEAYNFNTAVTQNITLYAKWEKDHYATKELSYTVEYYKDGVEVEADKQVEKQSVWAGAPNTLTVDASKINTTNKYDGYKLNGTATGEIPSTIANNGVIKVYYVKDEDQTKELKYTVEYYKDGVEVEADKQVEKQSVWAGAPNTLTVDASKINTTNKYDGYKLNSTATGEIPSTIDNDGVIKVYYVKDDSQTQTLNYTIIQHFRDGKGNPSAANPDITTNKTTTNAQAKLDSLITDDLKQAKTRTDGKTYVYVPSETKFTVNSGAVTALVDGTEIHLYYYLDETGTPGKDSEGKDTDTPNGQPDAWEYKATFIVKNGQWDTNPTGGSDTIVKYLPTKNITTGESIPAKLSNVPTAGNTPDSHYKAGSWDPKPNEGDVITKDMTYTYTYSWRSSGGSGGSNRPKPPVVDIPDDVPTGLNGKDHYAYIIGYGNNDVRPQNNITRAEVATIFFRLLTDETREANMTKSNGYNDVKDGDWFCCAVSTLSKMGIIKGYEDGSFKPNDPISRAEFAAIAARFDPDGDKTPATFADVTSHWAKDEISIAANHGWIKGYEDGSFKPDQKITRAETMTLVNRVLNRLPETKDDLHKDMKTWVDNMDETAWYYLAVQEATNSHYFKNKTSTKFEQWTDLRDTRDWSELEK